MGIDLFEYEKTPEPSGPQPRSDQEIAEALYRKAKPKAEEPEEEKPEKPERKIKNDRESSEDLQEALYPAWNPQFAKMDASGRVEERIFDNDGHVLAGGFVDKPETLVAQRPELLSNANLDGMVLPTLQHVDLRRASMKGTRIGDVQWSDCRGIEVDSETDLEGSNWAWTKITVEDYERLRGAKNFDKAKNLGRPLE